MDEIETVEAIEGLFTRGGSAFEGRDSGLSPRLTASLRGGRRQLSDKVELLAARLDELDLAATATLEPGGMVELQVEDEELRLSYRFKGRVRITGDGAPDLPADARHTIVLELVGLPLLVRRGPRSAKPDTSKGRRLRSEPRVVAA